MYGGITQSKLADVVEFLDRHLASVGLILESWILFVDKNSLILIGFATAGEFQRTTSGKSIGTSANNIASSADALILNIKTLVKLTKISTYLV